VLSSCKLHTNSPHWDFFFHKSIWHVSTLEKRGKLIKKKERGNVLGLIATNFSGNGFHVLHFPWQYWLYTKQRKEITMMQTFTWHGCTRVKMSSMTKLSQYPNYGNNQDTPLLMNGSRKCGTCTRWNFTQPWRRIKYHHLQVNGWN
jgi:hypothetical protein